MDSFSPANALFADKIATVDANNFRSLNYFALGAASHDWAGASVLLSCKLLWFFAGVTLILTSAKLEKLIAQAKLALLAAHIFVVGETGGTDIGVWQLGTCNAFLLDKLVLLNCHRKLLLRFLLICLGESSFEPFELLGQRIDCLFCVSYAHFRYRFRFFDCTYLHHPGRHVEHAISHGPVLDT